MVIVQENSLPGPQPAKADPFAYTALAVMAAEYRIEQCCNDGCRPDSQARLNIFPLGRPGLGGSADPS
jgi:hypothetical protein